MRLPNNEVHAALDALASGGPNRQVGLSLTPLTAGPDGLSGVTEPVGGGYARASLPASAWAAAANRAVQSSPVVFPDPTEDWGVPVAYFLTDGAGVPSIGFAIGGGGIQVLAGSSKPTVLPRIPAPL